MGNKRKKKKANFFIRALRTIFLFALIFVVTVLGTKYYFYESDYSVDNTDLSVVYINGLSLGTNIDEIDLSEFVETDTPIEDCDYNYEGISFNVDSKGNIDYIIASYSKVELDVGQDDETSLKYVNTILEILGDNYITEIYKSEENNYRKIATYVDNENDIHLGLVYSRYNNEMILIILSEDKIES